MFDVTPNEIAELNDTDLRELVGRLCEAELKAQGHSPVAVTWGGNQTAADGGLDVRVALTGDAIPGFIPRPASGFQVKAQDMPRKQILEEMRPGGAIRLAILELVAAGGAYVMVSSRGSTADSALKNRRTAMRDALAGVADADSFLLDFYDRTRIATWTRMHPGLIAWVKEKIGRPYVGWHPYGAWCNAAESVDAEYLVDDKLKVRIGQTSEAPSTVDAIDQVRDLLANPGGMVRLVGLSGVGKTRFAQALFDARVGARPLAPDLAVYTNMSDEPDPTPIGLASSLIASRTRAVLVIDNCPSDLHRRLSDLCRGTTLSVLTIEYDVRDDQPEGTDVVNLEPSSELLIRELLGRRFRNLSATDRQVIAEASGGNSRMAVALAGTVAQTGTVAGLSDEELFARLFYQRHGESDVLLRAAQALSLVYSFEGESIDDLTAELSRLAVLGDMSARDLYRQVEELRRRDLVQKRAQWRAVLPHAIANRLAARALAETPVRLIEQQLAASGNERLAISFSRRLGYLHTDQCATEIVERWLAPGGLLGDVTSMATHHHAMFVNVAPVSPEATLAALERARDGGPAEAAGTFQRYWATLRSLAYDARLFERSAMALVEGVVADPKSNAAKQVSTAFLSLFTVLHSGTHASIEQRLAVVERLLRSGDDVLQALGVSAVGRLLTALHFSPISQFSFGARSRDEGFRPKGADGLRQWFAPVLDLIERMVVRERILVDGLSQTLGLKFMDVWLHGHVGEALDVLARQVAEMGFWREGWLGCRQTLRVHGSKLSIESKSRLIALEKHLRPSNLAQRIRAFVLGHQGHEIDFEDDTEGSAGDAYERAELLALELGTTAATDVTCLSAVAVDLVRGGSRTWAFGRGLATGASDPHEVWNLLCEGRRACKPNERNVQVFRGFMAGLHERNPAVAQDILDASVVDGDLLEWAPALQSAVGLDARGVMRLLTALSKGGVPIGMFGYLSYGRATSETPGELLKQLLIQLSKQPGGFPVAVEILHMRLYADAQEKRSHDAAILDAGRELLGAIQFEAHTSHDDSGLDTLCRACLVGPEQSALAAKVMGRFKDAVASFQTNAFENNDLVKALCELQPLATLDALFTGTASDLQSGVAVFDHLGDHTPSPASALSIEALIEWCDIDSATRYPIAAIFVPTTSQADSAAKLGWSAHACALLANQATFSNVLTALVARFSPSSWSGSRATIIESHLCLLDDLGAVAPASAASTVAELKRKVVSEAESERRWEMANDRSRDERFE